MLVSTLCITIEHVAVALLSRQCLQGCCLMLPESSGLSAADSACTVSICHCSQVILQGNQPQIASSATVNGGRINIAACSIGGAQFCIDTAQEYVQNRVQFTQPLAGFQNTAFKLADMTTAVQASRLMVRCFSQLCSSKPVLHKRACIKQQWKSCAPLHLQAH